MSCYIDGVIGRGTPKVRLAKLEGERRDTDSQSRSAPLATTEKRETEPQRNGNFIFIAFAHGNLTLTKKMQSIKCGLPMGAREGWVLDGRCSKEIYDFEGEN
ncbi:hypothetical protein CFP56_011992 [Quercus suber]|uniref:Uncharacterized protein n=1 Tax=Quercus suber TaxID=58331 RepID=A0AAW0KYJ4_QUESU